MIILAGGIGSGKSTVARILRLKGYGVFDCDFEARVLMEHDERLKTALKMIAGAEIYDDSGRLDRKKLGEQLFTNPKLRKEVNAAVHTAVRLGVDKWLREAEENIFVETAIAAESRLADKADCIWLVTASEEVCRERVVCRDNRTTEEISRIMKAQSLEESLLEQTGKKIVRIHNDDSQSLMRQIDLILNKINYA